MTMVSKSNPAAQTGDVEEPLDLVTVRLGNQLVGLPIDRVRDVFQVPAITPVPLAPASVAGIANLRGRIVLLIDLATRLGLVANPPKGARMAVGIDWQGETYGLLVDTVGDVLHVPVAQATLAPATIAETWARHVRRIIKLDREVMIEIDLDGLLGSSLHAAA